METIRFHSMGTDILIALDSSNSADSEELSKTQLWFEEWENTMSRFRITSELSEINRNQGRMIQVSKTMFDVLLKTAQMKEYSNGLVKPTLLNPLLAAGYTESFENLSSEFKFTSSYLFDYDFRDNDIILDKENQSIYLPFGVQIDLGGIAKSWAANQIVQKLKEIAPVLVDAGGDICISEKQKDGSPWLIGIANPLIIEENVDLLCVEQGGIATSGRDRRKWLKNGKPQHHIIDPRTNTPAETDILTATIIAADATEAETAAKCAVILGSQDAEAWLQTKKDLEYLLILEDGYQIKSTAFPKYEWKIPCQPIIMS